MNEVAIIRDEVTKELANPETLKTLVQTTFKGVHESLVPQAIVEGRIRGFTFKDFLERNIYAVPYGSTYSLVTGIDYARKVGMRSGVIFKSEPKYEERQENGVTKLISCTITIKRRVGQDIAEYTAKVYFNEYSTGNNLWKSKPRTMIAKVAEMHALRMACPEELAQAYAEEEMEKEVAAPEAPKATLTDEQVNLYTSKLQATANMDQLQAAWAELPAEAKQHPAVMQMKDIIKEKHEGK